MKLGNDCNVKSRREGIFLNNHNLKSYMWINLFSLICAILSTSGWLVHEVHLGVVWDSLFWMLSAVVLCHWAVPCLDFNFNLVSMELMLPACSHKGSFDKKPKKQKNNKKNLLSKIHLKMISYRCPQCSYVHWLALGACLFSHNRELFYTSHLAFSSMTVAHIPWGPCKLAKSSMKACQ